MENVVIILLAIGLAISLYFNYKASKKFKVEPGDSWKLTVFGNDKAEAMSDKDALVPTFTLNGFVSTQSILHTISGSGLDIYLQRVVPKPPTPPIIVSRILIEVGKPNGPL